MSRAGKITRRAFLGVGVVAAGGLAVGYYFYRKPYANPLEAIAAEGEAVFNPYIKISSDNTITIIAPRAEMGQGVHTTLAALVVEELDVALDQVTVEHGPASSAYYNAAMLEEGGPFPFFDESFTAQVARGGMKVVSKFLGLQVTGGSSAMADAYEKMREAGCAARHVLISAAASRWNVPEDGLQTADGGVVNPATGDRLSYGDVAMLAAALSPPSNMKLRPRSDWKILGTSQSRVEIEDKVTGGRIFGIDVTLPDMLYGTVKMSPRFGAGAKSVDKTATMAVPGVLDVVDIDTTTGKGFGIVAENTWAAFQGADALSVEWDDAPYPADTAGMRKVIDDALAKEADFEMGGDGDVEAAFADAPAGEILEAEYEVPYLAHTAMEPMNATAQFKDGKLDVWAGTQAPGIAEMTCASLLGLEDEAVTVHTTRLGGGFGRRGEVDFALYAAAMAQKTNGRPIKVTWTREEDTRHDTYRPMAKGRFRARVSPDAGLTALDMQMAGPSIIESVLRRTFPDMSPAGPEKPLLDGAYNQPLTVPNRRYQGKLADLPIPVGFWRSVGNSVNGYFHECFLDEAAEKANADPLAFRLALMQDDRFLPARETLKKAAEMSGWGTPLPDGKGRGVAHTISFGTWVAEVVQVDVSDAGVRIEKVWCAADPGLVLDPDNFKAQMVSGIIYGLSQAFGQEITFADGEVEQGNFTDFDAMRMYQCPEIEVALLENSPKMGGAGEPGTPPSTPALANAIYAATGQRLRRMPFSQDIEFV